MPEGRDRRLWIVTTLGLVLVAILVRLAVNFSHSYPPGVNAAYYPLQTRSWITYGRLMYDDLPLVFWLNAALSRVLAAFGRPLDEAALLATRVLDSVIEPWSAAIVMAFGYVWSGGRRTALIGCVAASMLVVLSPPIMRMLSDFEKNSVGLTLMCGALWACRGAMIQPTFVRWLRLCTVLALVALTHVGAFAVTMTLVGTALAAWAALSLPREARAPALAAGIGAAGLVVALLASFDGHRARSLLRAPAALFRAGSIEFPPIPIVVVALLLIVVVMHMTWRDRHDLASADIAVVGAAAATMVVLGMPKSFVYFDRLMLMVPAPGSLLLAFAIARSRRIGIWTGPALLVVSIFGAATSAATVQPPMMTPEVAAELQALRPQISEPESTLVVAPHGLEWWAGHLLGTPVRSEVSDRSSRAYSRVLVLRNTVDCPRDRVSPFPAPPLNTQARKLYAGRCLELYQTP
jgi:hypothetical protein